MLLTGRQLAALSAIREVRARHHLLTFEPSPIFAQLAHERSKRILIRAANRVGKTRHLAWIIADRMVNNSRYRARVVGPTNDHIHNVLGKYLSEFLGPHLAPGSYYVEGKGWNGGRARTIILDNGSICELKSLKDDPDAHSGRSCHIIGFDEPPTLAHYTENAARLVDTRGQMIIAATMVNRPVAWLRTMVQGEEDNPGPGRTVHGSGWVQFVAAFSRENCPWYTDEQIEEWLSTMQTSPWEYGQRVHGEWDGVTPERIFIGVDESTFSHDPPSGQVRIGLGIDHGVVAGHQAAVLIAYRDTMIWVIDEYVSSVATAPEDDARGILRMLSRHHIQPTSVDMAVGDVNTGKGFAGWRVNQAIELAIAQAMHRRTSPFVIQSPDKTPGSVDWGLRCINYSARRGDLLVHPRCTHLADCLKHWKGRKVGDDGKLSHIADALRYVLTAAIGSHATYARLRFE